MIFRIKVFTWFAIHSWSYMRGQRKAMLKGFIPSWHKFYSLSKADR